MITWKRVFNQWEAPNEKKQATGPQRLEFDTLEIHLKPAFVEELDVVLFSVF